MKFAVSKIGITLLFLIIIFSYGLYDFYITGVTGGRAGPDYSRDDSSFGYYFFMALYSVGALSCLFSYLYLLFNPHVIDKKNQQDDSEPEN